MDTRRYELILERPCEHDRMVPHEFGWPDNGRSCDGGERIKLGELVLKPEFIQKWKEARSG